MLIINMSNINKQGTLEQMTLINAGGLRLVF